MRKRKELEGMIKWKIQSKRFIIPKGSDKNVTLGWLQIGNFGGIEILAKRAIGSSIFYFFCRSLPSFAKKIQTAFVNNI